MRENAYQAQLIKELKHLFPGCLVLKNDSSYIQGIPDLTILYRNRWAALEVKTSEHAPIQPNQDYYVDWLNQMSYAAYIYPENEKDVLIELQLALQPRREARVPLR